MNFSLLETAKKIQSIAQAGISFATDEYDLERYEQLRQISAEILSNISETEITKVKSLFLNDDGYQTPKVDIRAVIFKEEKILLVREKSDNKWSLPGGWADIGLTPAEVVVKEVKEESGLDVDPVKIFAVFDKKCHSHPPSPYHVYKIFFLCKIIGGKIQKGLETNNVQYFSKENLPELSLSRNTLLQIEKMFYLKGNPDLPTLFD